MSEWVALGVIGLAADVLCVGACLWWLRVRRWKR